MSGRRDIARMNQVAAYVRDKGECSMGEIALQLGISPSVQYMLARTYREFYQDLRLERSRWKTIEIKEPIQVPSVAQDQLSAQGKEMR